MMRVAAWIGCVLMLGGCATDLSKIGAEPGMTPVGHGLYAQRASFPMNTFQPLARKEYNSLWVAGREDFFRDPRARKIGDVLTVKIAIKDKATLDNSSDRSRSSKADIGINLALGSSATGDASADAGGGSNSAGKGSIDRSEEIELSVAAVVTEQLPNGNLIISGSQEIRVNYEVRVLHVAGIVRPRDIAGDNTITYEKIAEARVSYGGRGRITEVQQPAWGQQLYDMVTPF